MSEKLTDSALYDVSKKELLAAALPGNPPREAPRFPTILLAAFEDNVMSADVLVFWRAMSWWLILQSWATLRFDDHRGITPSEVNVSSSGLNGRLTRTKVSGPDKRHNFRLLVVHPSAFRGSKRKELTYQTAFAAQSQIISLASYRGLRIFRMSTGHYNTPHSGRNFYAFSNIRPQLRPKRSRHVGRMGFGRK